MLPALTVWCGDLVWHVAASIKATADHRKCDSSFILIYRGSSIITYYVFWRLVDEFLESNQAK
jgi:hypothetical protein